MTFGQIITRARKGKNLSQRKLASLIKKEDGHPISAPYINDIEHGRCIPASDHLIEQFSKTLGIKPEVLYFVTRRFPPDLYVEPANEKLIVAAIKECRKVLRGRARG
jgi:transcriptional regulator with XRE-family HTH domain